MQNAFSFDIYKQGNFDFSKEALKIFDYQVKNNTVYNTFVKNLGFKKSSIKNITDIPFLPVEFFKYKKVTTGEPIAAVFESSGTTGSTSSKHYVPDINLYENSFSTAFEKFYGKAKDYCILALLPGYLERENASLVYMADNLIKQSRYSESGFYLYDHKKLAATLQKNEEKQIPTILLGVTFALLDFAESFPMPLSGTIIMETGGMKGKRREMIREEVHQILKDSFSVEQIHSEYGMTELLSQAYSKKDGLYQTPPWMKVLVYDLYNPLDTKLSGKGGIKIVDMANIYSCAFIQTQDIGEVYPDGSFRISGRMDESDIRGCNLMVI